MARRGRPTKYNKARHDEIVRSLEAGLSRTTAAELAGIQRGTLEEWREKYPAFSYDVRQAMAKAKARATVTITQAIKSGDVNAAFRYLSYQEPDEWNAPDRHEISGKDGSPLTIVFSPREDGPQ